MAHLSSAFCLLAQAKARGLLVVGTRAKGSHVGRVALLISVKKGWGLFARRSHPTSASLPAGYGVLPFGRTSLVRGGRIACMLLMQPSQPINGLDRSRILPEDQFNAAVPSTLGE
jgi:hypothetical protein